MMNVLQRIEYRVELSPKNAESKNDGNRRMLSVALWANKLSMVEYPIWLRVPLPCKWEDHLMSSIASFHNP